MTEHTYTEIVKALRGLVADPSSVQRIRLTNMSPDAVQRAQWAVYYHRQKLNLGPIKTRFFVESGTLVMRLKLGVG